MLTIYKYHGAGNDFILIDNRNDTFNVDTELINTLCHRRFGIGADGLMLLEHHESHDFTMRYFNSDGKEATMCGNGGRCIVAFANKLGIIKETTSFMAVDGVHQAKMLSPQTVSLEMTEVSAIQQYDDGYFLDTGSPHFVKFIDASYTHKQVVDEGKKLRNDARFSPDGTNVNFVTVQDNSLLIRTYERGVEDETLACGTGVTAAAISAHRHLNTDKKSFTVKARGGNLNVSFENSGQHYQNIWLTGPAKFVFEGVIDLTNFASQD